MDTYRFEHWASLRARIPTKPAARTGINSLSFPWFHSVGVHIHRRGSLIFLDASGAVRSDTYWTPAAFREETIQICFNASLLLLWKGRQQWRNGRQRNVGVAVSPLPLPPPSLPSCRQLIPPRSARGHCASALGAPETRSASHPQSEGTLMRRRRRKRRRTEMEKSRAATTLRQERTTTPLGTMGNENSGLFCIYYDEILVRSIRHEHTPHWSLRNTATGSRCVQLVSCQQVVVLVYVKGQQSKGFFILFLLPVLLTEPPFFTK